MTSTEVTLPGGFPLGDGAILNDRLGGPDVPIASGKITIGLGPWGSAILSP